MKEQKPNLYCHNTPPDWNDPHEVKLLVTTSKKNELGAIPRGLEHAKKGIVAFDQISRKWYAIRHFPCGLDCYCAAQAKELSGPNEKHKWDDIEIPDEDDDECPTCGRSCEC